MSENGAFGTIVQSSLRFVGGGIQLIRQASVESGDFESWMQSQSAIAADNRSQCDQLTVGAIFHDQRKLSSRSTVSLRSMGKSFDSAGSDGSDTDYNKFRKSLRRNSKASVPSTTRTIALEEYTKLTQEHAKYKRIVDNLSSDYEDSKQHEIFRRYVLLKAMIKRTVMYIKLGQLPDLNGAMIVGNMCLHASGITRWSPICPSNYSKAELSERANDLKRKIGLLRGQIQILADSYEASKQYICIQKYRLMKFMLKELFQNCKNF